MLERNQAVEHSQEVSKLEAEIASLRTRIEDLHYENRLALHQTEMYEKFLPSRVKPFEEKEVLTQVVDGHYLCVTNSGLKWFKTPHVPQLKEVL